MRSRIVGANISIKNILRLKALEKSKQPVTLRHQIYLDNGELYEVDIACTEGYSEATFNDAMQKALNIFPSPPNRIDLISIIPIQDSSEFIKPAGDC